MPDAVAYVNWGRWVADCPYGCGSAVQLELGQPSAQCAPAVNGGCGRIAAVRWPVNADSIMQALGKRPAPRNRNWFPLGHPLAVRGEMPHGQTVHDLEAETDKHVADEIVPPEEEKRRELDRLLASHGLRLAPDGESLRRL